MNGGTETMSLRGWAHHADVSPSYASRLVADGHIRRTPEGKIDVADADRALARLRETASPGRLQAAEERRRLRDRALEAVKGVGTRDDDEVGTSDESLPPEGESRVMAAFGAHRVPLLPAKAGEEGPVDRDEADAALDEQERAMAFPEFRPRNQIEAVAHRLELRLAAAQVQIHTDSRKAIRAAARDSDRLTRALGSMFGRLRALLDQERDRLIRELHEIAKASKK